MISLDKTTRKLQVALAGAVTTNELHVTVSYYDVPAQTKSGTEEYRRVVSTNVTTGATAVDVCDAPSTNNTVRNIVYLCVHNADTVAATPTVQIDDSSTKYRQMAKSLTAGQSLVYEHGAGWLVL